jgi:mannosyltransferase
MSLGAPAVEGKSSARRRYDAANGLPWLDRRASASASAAAIVLGAITLAGLLLRLRSFGDSLFGDELSTYYVVTGRSPGGILHLLNGHFIDLNPPLFFISAWASEKVFGASAQSLKLVSLLAGTATIPLTYLLGRLTVSVRAGLVASALVALSPFMIFYSTEARPYALLALTCLLSTLALLQATRTGRRRWWIVYAVCSCAAVYTQYTAVFLLAAQFAWAFVTQPQARRALLAANLGAAIGFLPWLPSLIRTTHNSLTKVYAGINPLNLHDIRIDLEHWSIGHPILPLATVPGHIAVAIALAALAVAALGIALRTWPPQRPRAAVRVRPETALVAVLACAAPVLIAAYSFVGQSVWDARDLISSWPAFAVLVAALVTYARAPWWLAATGLVIVAFAVGATKMLATSTQRPDYQGAAAYLDRTAPRGGPAVEFGALTPGPLTELEAAIALRGSARRHPVVRLGRPPLGAELRVPQDVPPQREAAPRPANLVAREAAAAAGDGVMFLVAPTSAPITALQAIRGLHVGDGIRAEQSLTSFLDSLPECRTQRAACDSFIGFPAAFLGALPSRFQLAGARTYQGISPVTVYVFQG